MSMVRSLGAANIKRIFSGAIPSRSFSQSRHNIRSTTRTIPLPLLPLLRNAPSGPFASRSLTSQTGTGAAGTPDTSMTPDRVAGMLLLEGTQLLDALEERKNNKEDLELREIEQVAGLFRQAYSTSLEEGRRQAATGTAIAPGLKQTYLQLEAISLAGLARLAMAAGSIDDAKAAVALLQKDYTEQVNTVQDIKKAVGMVTILATSQNNEVHTFRTRIETDPDDLDARFQLSTVFFSTGNYEEALNECFLLLRRKEGKTWNEGAAKTRVLEIFDVLGPENNLVKKGRQRLSSILFM